jgi:hypothetical protein
MDIVIGLLVILGTPAAIVFGMKQKQSFHRRHYRD